MQTKLGPSTVWLVIIMFACLCALPMGVAAQSAAATQYVGTACSLDGFCPEGLVCVSTTSGGTNGTAAKTTRMCEYCTSNTQCDATADPLYVCTARTCQRKGLFEGSLHWQDALTAVVVFVLACVAAGGGIGGGGVFIPTYILVASLTPKLAIPMSASTIFGVAVANLVQLIPRRHPEADRPLIEYKLAFLIQPLALAGTGLGVLLNLVFPNWLVLVLLLIVLGVAAYRSFRRGFRLHREEVAVAAEMDTDSVPMGEQDGKVGGDSAASGGDKDEEQGSSTAGAKATEDVSAEVQDALEKDKRTPLEIIAAILVVLAMMTLVSLFKRDVARCSGEFWGLTFGPLAVVLLLFGVVAYLVLREHERRVGIGYTYLEGDMQYDLNKLGVICGLALLAGIAAGLLGIGGGMLLNPMMLELGVSPQVTAATSAFMVFWTSLSSTLQYVILDRLLWDYALFYACLGTIASFVGQIGLDRLVRRYKKKSLIVLSIACIIGASLFALTGIGISNIVRDVNGGRTSSLQFQDLCV